jgi:hypothetical protein
MQIIVARRLVLAESCMLTVTYPDMASYSFFSFDPHHQSVT